MIGIGRAEACGRGERVGAGIGITGKVAGSVADGDETGVWAFAAPPRAAPMRIESMSTRMTSLFCV
jgi:hypothetical protein